MLGGRALLALLLVAGVAGCGGSAPLAVVGGQHVTKTQVRQLVEHAREEARREGSDFPAAGSDGYRELEQQALAILVARAQIVEAAARLGVRVTDAEVTQRVAFPHKELVETLYEGAREQLGSPEENEKGAAAQVLADAVRVQLTLQKVRARVGPSRLDGWVAKARKLPVDYAGGWGPDA